MCFKKHTDDIMANAHELKPPPRPYTPYNIFFQIEREYILQNMDVVSSPKAEDLFMGFDDANYSDLELPARYEGLVLSNDWYQPGKTQRKKRQHRATHGKISFVELSKRIASSWRHADDETKIFCARLADVGMQKYKREIHEYNKVAKKDPQSRAKTDELVTKAMKKGASKRSPPACKAKSAEEPNIASKFHAPLPIGTDNVASGAAGLMAKPGATASSALVEAPFTSFNIPAPFPETPGSFDRVTASSFQLGAQAQSASFDQIDCGPHKRVAEPGGCVDLADSDILEMWKRTP